MRIHVLYVTLLMAAAGAAVPAAADEVEAMCMVMRLAGGQEVCVALDNDAAHDGPRWLNRERRIVAEGHSYTADEVESIRFETRRVDGIDEATAATSEATPPHTYTLSGQRVDTSRHGRLPRGIYISGGKKHIVR